MLTIASHLLSLLSVDSVAPRHLWGPLAARLFAASLSGSFYAPSSSASNIMSSELSLIGTVLSQDMLNFPM